MAISRKSDFRRIRAIISEKQENPEKLAEFQGPYAYVCKQKGWSTGAGLLVYTLIAVFDKMGTVTAVEFSIGKIEEGWKRL